MTDKVQKIREEVERLRKSYQIMYQELDCESPELMSVCAKRNLCQDILMFIDSLQEELKPKFKVGDRICKSKIGDLKGVVINEICSDHYMCNGACIYFTEQDDWELVEESVTKQSVEEVMQDVEEKSKAFTEAHKREGAEEILAGMKGIDPSIQDIVDKHWFEMLGEEPILEVLAKYLDHVSKEEAMKTKGAIDRWFSEYYPEPASEDKLEGLCNAFHLALDDDEPVNEDLEEESKKYSSCIYLEEVLSDDDKEVLRERLINTFKAGAQWQKQRDKDEIRMIRELLDNFDKTCDEYHDAGFKHGQEALIKDAVEATVHGVSGREGSTMKGIAVTAYADVPDCNFGDKVKVIFIKES